MTRKSALPPGPTITSPSRWTWRNCCRSCASGCRSKARVVTSVSDVDIELKLLVDAIYLKYHYDFRGYAQASLKRRLTAAMIRFDCKTMSQLQDKVLHDP